VGVHRISVLRPAAAAVVASKARSLAVRSDSRNSEVGKAALSEPQRAPDCNNGNARFAQMQWLAGGSAADNG